MTPTVLVVGPDLLARGGLSSKLRAHGCMVHETDGGEEALNALNGQEVDVVLLDLRGLGDEALSLLRKSKDLSPWAEVVMITSKEHIGLSIKGMRLGAFDDLMTPFEASELVNKVRAAAESQGRKVRAGLGRLPRALKRFVETVGLTGANMVYGLAPPLDREGWI